MVDDEVLMALRVLALTEIELYFAGDVDEVNSPTEIVICSLLAAFAFVGDQGPACRVSGQQT